MSLLVVGLSHRSAPVSVLERASLSADAKVKLLHDTLAAEPATEATVLATCNRIELYADVDKFHAGVAELSTLLAQHSGVGLEELTPYLALSLGKRIETVPIRGNVDTRIGFVRDGELDAVVLAAAGLNRIGRGDEATDLLPVDSVLPAPGQGALAVECLASDTDLVAALGELDDPHTRAAVTAERSLLAALEAGCSAPVGAFADLLADGEIVNEMRLRGVVGTLDGTTLVQLSTTGPVPQSYDEAMALGRELADEMLAKGAAGLMGERSL
ncbi:Porphobilinogen deaminase [Streptomyces avidinii]